MRILIGTQVFIAVFASLALLLLGTMPGSLALLYGSSLGILLTLLVRHSTDKALEKAIDNPRHGVVVMFSGFTLRYAIAILGLLLGFKVLKLMAIPMISGFILMVIVQVLTAYRVKA